jgi:DDB1- and CUL4-associated factor 11
MVKVWDRRLLSSVDASPDAPLAEPAGFLPGHHGGMTSVSPRGDGVYMLSNSKDQTAKLWDVRKMTTSPVPRATWERTGAEWDYRWEPYPL